MSIQIRECSQQGRSFPSQLFLRSAMKNAGKTGLECCRLKLDTTRILFFRAYPGKRTT
jgi:hypothetical protein